MAYDVKGNMSIVSMIAENDMDEDHVVVVAGTSEGQVDLPGATTDTPLGVILNTASAGETVAVAMGGGIIKIVAHAAVAANARVSIGATTGRVDDAAEGTVSTKYVGVALAAASAAGELIPVAVNLPGVCEDGGAS